MRDVVILGAGLAGSSLAAVLGALGWDVVLVERRHFPHHKVCGEFLSPEAQASLWAMGLYETVATLAPSRMHRAGLVSRLGLRLEMDLPDTAWGVSRLALDHALATAAARAGVELRMGVTATAVTPTARGSTVHLRTPQGPDDLTARAVIAACGRNPPVQLRPRANALELQHTYVGVKCHYAEVAMPSQVELFLFDGGYVGLSPIEHGRYNLCLLATRAAFQRSGGTIRSMLDAVARWNPALGRRLAGSRPLPDSEVAVAPVHTHRTPTPWDTLARVGDAAVMIPPLCGDGMAMALRSAELCAPLAHAFLQGNLSLEGWATAYRRTWHDEFDQTVRTGRRLQTLLAQPLLSDALLACGHLAPALADRLVRATRGRPRPLEQVQPIVAPLR